MREVAEEQCSRCMEHIETGGSESVDDGIDGTGIGFDGFDGIMVVGDEW